MKKLLLAGLLSTMFGVSWCSPAQGAEDYLLLGLYQPPEAGKGYWCRGGQMEQVPLSDRKDYREASKNFYAKHDKEWASPTLMGPDEAAIVYRFKTSLSGFECEKQVLGVMTGLDVEDARKKLADHVAKKPKGFPGRPEVIFTWTGGDYKRKVKKDYGGLEITFMAYETGSGTQGSVMISTTKTNVSS